MLTVLVWMEFLGVAIALCITPARLAGEQPFQTLNRWLQHWWVTNLMRALSAIFSLRVEVNGDDCLNPPPGLMLIRHSSLIDTLLPVLILSKQAIRFRYVLKHELLFDPCLDLVGCRLPNAFIKRQGNAETELKMLSELARTTEDNETVIIYPEGTRFTADRRAALLSRLRAKSSKRVELAESLKHTLPPRPGGSLTLLNQLQERSVVIVAHVGFEGAARISDVFNGSLVGKRIAIQIWRIQPDELPRDDADQREWLDQWWGRVDQWIDQQLNQP
jgi:1-acyl-sn-glycerol-3-phosphate acyltransferase